MNIEELGLSVRPLNVLLNNEKITTVEELTAMPRDWLLCLPNMGRKSLREIEDALAKHGYKLTSKQDDYPGWLTELRLSPLVKYRVHFYGWTLQKVLDGPRSDLLKATNFGRKSLKDLEVALINAGYKPKWSAPEPKDKAQAFFKRAELLEAQATALRNEALSLLALDHKTKSRHNP